MPDVYTIAASADDANEFVDGSVTIDNDLLIESDPTWIGLRFTGVEKPAGGTLIAARIILHPLSTNGDGSFASTLYGESGAAAAAFAATANNLSSRSRTTGIVWDEAAIISDPIDSPDVTTIVNAIMALSGWDGVLAFLIHGTIAFGGGYYGSSISFNSLDLSGGDATPRLELEWSVPQTIVAVPLVVAVSLPPATADMSLTVEGTPLATSPAMPPATASGDAIVSASLLAAASVMQADAEMPLNVAGAGDVAWSAAAWNDADAIQVRGWPPALRENVRRWGAAVACETGGRVGLVDARVKHLFHGHRQHRQYLARHAILDSVGFDPQLHVETASNGTLRWSAAAPPELRRAVAEYITSRREDDD